VAVVDVFHVLSFYFYKIDVNIVASSPKKISCSSLIRNQPEDGFLKKL